MTFLCYHDNFIMLSWYRCLFIIILLPCYVIILLCYQDNMLSYIFLCKLHALNQNEAASPHCLKLLQRFVFYKNPYMSNKGISLRLQLRHWLQQSYVAFRLRLRNTQYAVLLALFLPQRWLDKESVGFKKWSIELQNPEN
jgi:hypothetical protein